MGEPLFGVAIDETVTFAACVVLMNHWSKPIDHRSFRLNRARCGGMEYVRQTRYVIFLFSRIRQLQHSNEHRWNSLCVSNAEFFDTMQELLSIKVVHDD